MADIVKFRGETMEIMTRQQARDRGETKYFTGEPCRNGHVDYRYVGSATCASCIKSSRPQAKNVDNFMARDEMKQAAADRTAAKAQMMEIKVRAYPKDYGTLRDIAATLMRLRWPFMRPEDAMSSKSGMDGAGGTLLYRLHAHPDDAAAVQATAGRLIAANGVDIAAERARIFRIAQQQAEDDVEEPAWQP